MSKKINKSKGVNPLISEEDILDDSEATTLRPGGRGAARTAMQDDADGREESEDILYSEAVTLHGDGAEMDDEERSENDDAAAAPKEEQEGDAASAMDYKTNVTVMATPEQRQELRRLMEEAQAHPKFDLHQTSSGSSSATRSSAGQFRSRQSTRYHTTGGGMGTNARRLAQADDKGIVPGTIIGKFEIIRMIGQGGMGVIYLARHRDLKALRVLKVLPNSLAKENKVFYERFIREARLASEIHHTNVVGVMDIGTDEARGLTYIVMEYIDGGSLRQLLKVRKRLTEEEAVVIIVNICSALVMAEERGIVHRDIKPDNIMFTRNGEIKLADLGIAKGLNEDSNLTRNAALVGTPAYLPPEQLENAAKVDIRSDLYSLGITFYEMVTGVQPYTGGNTFETLHRLVNENAPSPRKLCPQLTEWCAAIIERMIQKEPKRRFQTPGEVLQALNNGPFQLNSLEMQELIRRALQDVQNSVGGASGDSTSSYTHGSRLRRSTYHRGRGFPWILTLCILILVAGAAAGYLYLRRSPSKKVTAGAAHQVEPAARVSDSEKSQEMPPAEVPAPVVVEAPKCPVLTLRVVPGAEIQAVAADTGAITTFFSNAKGEAVIDSLPVGFYEFKIKAEGYQPYSERLELKQTVSQEINLIALTHSITVITEPNAMLLLRAGDKEVWQGAADSAGLLVISNLSNGLYSLEGVCKGFAREKREVKLDRADCTVRLELSLLLADISVQTMPGSDVSLLQDGKVAQKGVANVRGVARLNKVPYGKYTVRAENFNRVVDEKEVEVQNAQMTVPLKTSLPMPAAPVKTAVVATSPAKPAAAKPVAAKSAVVVKSSSASVSQTGAVPGAAMVKEGGVKTSPAVASPVVPQKNPSVKAVQTPAVSTAENKSAVGVLPSAVAVAEQKKAPSATVAVRSGVQPSGSAVTVNAPKTPQVAAPKKAATAQKGHDATSSAQETIGELIEKYTVTESSKKAAVAQKEPPVRRMADTQIALLIDKYTAAAAALPEFDSEKAAWITLEKYADWRTQISGLIQKMRDEKKGACQAEKIESWQEELDDRLMVMPLLLDDRLSQTKLNKRLLDGRLTYSVVSDFLRELTEKIGRLKRKEFSREFGEMLSPHLKELEVELERMKTMPLNAVKRRNLHALQTLLEELSKQIRLSCERK